MTRKKKVYNTKEAFNGNTNLKNVGVQIEWTADKIIEYNKCRKDVKYFAEKYFKIVDLDKGFVNINLYDYQRDILDTFQKELRVVLLQCRQSGKCVCEDTEYTVRNKKTGEIMKCTAKEFHEMTKK